MCGTCSNLGVSWSPFWVICFSKRGCIARLLYNHKGMAKGFRQIQDKFVEGAQNETRIPQGHEACIHHVAVEAM